MVEVFSGVNYTGYGVKLPVGTYTKADLAVYGIKANDIESIKILKEGASARLYKSDNNIGITTNQLCKTDRKSLSTSYKNAINSITVMYEDPVGINRIDNEVATEDVTVYSLDGKMIGKGKNAMRSVSKGQTVIVRTGDKSSKIRIR